MHECHHQFQYQTGLNILPDELMEEGSCVSNHKKKWSPSNLGFHYTTIEHIFEFLSYGCYIREVSLTKASKVVADPERKKWRTNQIVLGKRWSLFEKETFDLFLSWGASTEVSNLEILMYWASIAGHEPLVIQLLDQGVSPSANTFSFAAKYGQKAILSLAKEKSDNSKQSLNESFHWAVFFIPDLELMEKTIRLLVEFGAEDQDGMALKRAQRIERPDIEMIIRSI